MRRAFLGLAVGFLGLALALWLARSARRPDAPLAPASVPSETADAVPAGSSHSAQGPSPNPLDPSSASRPLDGASVSTQAGESAPLRPVVPAPFAEEPLPPLETRDLARDVDIVKETVRFYRLEFGENPDGGFNDAITRQLSGANPGRLNFLPPGLGATNAAGELLDRFGRPYFFHPLSKDRMEIRSAGPNGEMFDGDDVVR